MDESKFGAILGSLRMNRCIADGPPLGRISIWTRTVHGLHAVRGLHADGPPVHRMADFCSLMMILLGLDIIFEYMNLMIDY